MKLSQLVVSIFSAVLFSFQLALANAPAGQEKAAEKQGEGHAKAEHSFELYQPHVANKSVTTPPEKVELVAPAFEAKVEGSVILKWKTSATADKYLVQVATDPNFKWLVVDEPAYTKTELEVKGLEKAKHYYWRVYSVKSNNNPGYMKGVASKSMFDTN